MSSNPLEDDPKRDRRIRERAYHLWKAGGEPHGRDAEFWERARELVGMEESAGSGQISPTADAAHRINGQIVDEAALEENLGEFPGRQTDQGDRQMAPTRKVAAPTPLPTSSAKPAKKAEKSASKPVEPVGKAAKPEAKSAAKPLKKAVEPEPKAKLATPKAKAKAPEPVVEPAKKPKGKSKKG